MPEAEIESCTLIDLKLVHSRYQVENEIADGDKGQFELKYSVEFEPNEKESSQFFILIDSHLKALRDDDTLFTTECRYKCLYSAELEEGININDFSPFSDALGKRIYLTVREHLLHLSREGQGIHLPIPYDLPRKNGEDESDEPEEE